jgi:Bacterial regulatory proteins, luxR family
MPIEVVLETKFSGRARGGGMYAAAHLVRDVAAAAVANAAGSHRQAARLLGVADAPRHSMGIVRFKVYDAGYQTMTTSLRDASGDSEFETDWAEGAALNLEEAIAYARRGRGERKRPTSGWASLTPAERDVIKLVRQGLSNNDIATRLFISPRTVATISPTSTPNSASPPGCSSLRKRPATADPRQRRRGQSNRAAAQSDTRQWPIQAM